MAPEKIKGWSYSGKDYWTHKSLKDFCGKKADWYFELSAAVFLDGEKKNRYCYSVIFGGSKYCKGGFKTATEAARAAELFAKKHFLREVSRFAVLSDKVLEGLK